MKPEITHIALLVSNLDKTINFYNQYCTLKVLHKRSDPNTGARTAWLGTDLSFVIVIMEENKKPIQSKSKPMNHIGFALDSKEEVDEIAKIAKEDGLLNYGPIYFDPVVGYICEILDPDGNSVEFSFGQELGKNTKK